VLGWITKEFNTSNLHHASLILDCRTLVNQIPQARMKHYFRKANKYTDALSGMELNSSQDFMLFDSLSVNLCMLSFYDTSGLYYEMQ